MANKGRAQPRVVCCAIPIARSSGQILLVTSRKRPSSWVLPKGGWEPSDRVLEAAASREALEEAGVRGTITRFVTTISTASTTYHFYELDVASLDQVWLECNERRREWVDYAEAIRRLAWKSELAQGLRASSLASWVNVEPRSESPKSYSFNFSIPPMPFRDLCHCHKARDSKGICRKAPSFNGYCTHQYIFHLLPILLYPPIDRFHTQNF